MDYGVVDPKFVDYQNVPFMAAVFSPLQLIERLDNQEVVESLRSLFHFLIPSTAFLALLVASCLLYRLSSALFGCLGTSSRPLRRKPQLTILAYFNMVFLFFIGLFFEANLNTESVLVRTDDLLYSIKQILGTQREFCLFEESLETDFLKKVSLSPLIELAVRVSVCPF